MARMGMALVWLPMHDFEIDVYKLASVQVLDSFMQMMNENSNVEVMLEFRKENPLCPTLALTSRTFDCSLLFVESKMTLIYLNRLSGLGGVEYIEPIMVEELGSSELDGGVAEDKLEVVLLENRGAALLPYSSYHTL